MKNVATLPRDLAADLLPRLCARFSSFRLVEGWGVEILRLEPGVAHMGLRANACTLNPNGVTVNGGVLAALADMACAVALSTAFDGAMSFVTADLHVRYLEPATGDAVAEARLLRLSPRSAVLECRIHVGPEVVALATAHFTLTTSKRP